MPLYRQLVRRCRNGMRGIGECVFGTKVGDPIFEGRVVCGFAWRVFECYFADFLFALLLVRHGEDAVPAGGWFVKEIFLATLPIGARGAVGLPLGENGLEGFLRGFPLALTVEFASEAEIL